MNLYGIVSLGGTVIGGSLNQRGLKGETGDTGDKGDAATIAVGSTTTGAAGTSASVTNSGTQYAAVLNFTIPKGDKGDTGATGDVNTYIAEYGSTTYAEIGSALSDGKYVIAQYNNDYYPLIMFSNSSYVFSYIHENICHEVVCDSYSTWTARTHTSVRDVKQNGASVTSSGVALVTTPQPTTTTPIMDGTAAVGSETTWAKGDHVHPKDTTKVDKEVGKGLSANDFTDSLKTKLEGVESGAEVNVQSDWNQSTNTADDYIKNKPNLSVYAPLDSPSLTGTPTAPTATEGTNTTQIATTAFVKTGDDAVKEMIKNTHPTDTASGAIASFPDGSDLFDYLSCVANITPIQDLHGYDKPWVGGSGANKWGGEAFLALSSVWGGAVVDYDAMTLKGSIPNLPTRANIYNGFEDGTQYTIFWGASIINTGLYVVYKDGTDSIILSGTPFVTDASKNVDYLRFYVSTSDEITFYANQIGVFKGALSASDYTPYSNLCPISGHDDLVIQQTGVNVWDEETELGGISSTNGSTYVDNTKLRSKNFCGVLPNTNYYFKKPTSALDIFFYDADKNFISVTYTANRVITTPSNAHYVKIVLPTAYGTTYKNDISINYPSTDHEYHAYNGTTYTQDIEATYTPTVQDNEAYLFKQTGDVGGDRETIEVVGGTVAWNQLLDIETMGAFIASTKSYDSATGVVTVTPTNYASNSIGFYTTAAQLRTKANHVYFTSVDINPDYSGLFLFGVEGSAKSERLNAGSYQTLATIAKRNGEYAVTLYLASQDWTTGVYKYKNGKVIDLTQMFGATIADYIYSLEQANAGAGVAWFRKLFPKPYYAYNAGELMSVQASSHDMVGFNAWDEQWVNAYHDVRGKQIADARFISCKNKIRVLPNTTYYFKSPNVDFELFEYDSNGDFISQSYSYLKNKTFTTRTNTGYIEFSSRVANALTTYNHDICINLSDPTRNGEYEPYVKHTYPLDSDLTLRGIPKLDASNNLYYDGDRYNANGSVDRRYGIVDLGSMTWTADGGNVYYIALTDAKSVNNANAMTDAPYTHIPQSATAYDKIYKTVRGASGLYVYFRNDSTASVNDFITTVQGKHLVYELATPTIETATPFENIQKVTPNYGTEEFVTDSIVPVGNNTQYYTRDIYGGTLDLVSGVLTVDRVSVTLNGSNSWASQDTLTTTRHYSCDVSGITASTGVYSDDVMGDSMQTIANNVDSVHMNHRNVAIHVWIPKDIAPSTYFATNPLQVVYPLANPQTYQLDPVQVACLLGQNNVWADCGDIDEVKYKADVQLWVEKQLREINTAILALS